MSIPSFMTTTAATQAAQANTATQRPVVKTLGQDDFLKLLTMQMQNQDPMTRRQIRILSRKWHSLPRWSSHGA